MSVVIVDDSTDGRARSIVDKFENCFALGAEYYRSGKQNISLARNIAIDAASRVADWTVMIDDDCEPPPEWLEALLETQQATNADAVTGTMVRRVPAGSPRWLTEEPFLQLGLDTGEDRAERLTASTFNSMISSRWLRDHPSIRFKAELGVIGGEDMVFYRAACSAGLRIRYSRRGFVYENQPPSRATLSYQLRSFFWHGNSSYVAAIQSGTSSWRMFLHGGKSLLFALIRPLVRVYRGRHPQLRYCLALVLHATGKMVGVLGIVVQHR